MTSSLRHTFERCRTTSSYLILEKWQDVRRQQQNIFATLRFICCNRKNVKIISSAKRYPTLLLKHFVIFIFSLFLFFKYHAILQCITYNYFVPPLSEYQSTDFRSKVLVFYESIIPSRTNNDHADSIVDEKHLTNLMEKYGIYGIIFKVRCIAGRFVISIPQFNMININYCFFVDTLTCNNASNSDGNGESKNSIGSLSKIHEFLAYQLKQKNYIQLDKRPVLVVSEQSYFSKTRAMLENAHCNKHQNYFAVIYVEWPVKHGPLHKTGFWPTVFGYRNKLKCPPETSSSSISFYSPILPQKEVAKWGSKSASYVFQSTLRQTFARLRERAEEKPTPFTLVNCWRSLEPSKSHGYAFLEANRMSHLNYNITSKSARPPSIAIFIHAFYLDLIQEIIEFLKVIQRKSPFRVEIYVAVLPSNEGIISAAFSELNWNVNILAFENRGRDVLPFVATLPNIMARHSIVVKVNTKKSIRNETKGDLWRKHSYKCLLQWNNFMKAVSDLQRSTSLGIIYPSSLVLPLKHFMRGTTEIFSKICLRMGFDPTNAVENLYFGAGTMFIARTNALGLLANLAFPESSFETEIGQIDETLAHGIERAIAVSVHMSGFTVKESDCFSKGVDFFLAEIAKL